MDNRLTHDAIIEDALQSQRLAPMPHSIIADVLARIQKENRPTLLTWNDAVLSLVIVLSVAALWFAYLNLPTIALVKLRIQGILLYQHYLVNARWLVPSLFFGVAALLSALTIPTLIQMTTDRRR